MKKSILILSVLFLPALSLAASGGLVTIGKDIGDILAIVKNLIFALAFIAFFYGLLKFIFSEGEDKEKGKSVMIWGVIALFVMFSIWGIISILQSSFTGTDGSALNIPADPIKTNGA